MDLWHVSCLPSPHLFSHISYLNYFKVTSWCISMWWKRAQSPGPDRVCFSAEWWPQTSQHPQPMSECKSRGQAEGHMPSREKDKNKEVERLGLHGAAKIFLLLLTFGCLPRATGREVKLLLLRSHSPWWQQFDGPLRNSYPLVTSDTWHRCIYLWNPKPPHHPPPLSPVTCTLHPQSSSSLSSLSPGSICLLSFK